MYSAILGFFDGIVPGTGLFAVFDLAVIAFAWLTLPKLRPRMAWSGPIALALWFLTPQVLIYPGIVLRDVLFANLTVAAFVALALAARFWSRPTLRWLLLAVMVSCLAFGALVRQNGGVVIVPAALALGWIAAQGRWGRGLAWGVGGLVATLVLAVALSAANPVRVSPVRAPDYGPQLLAHYDIMAALAEDPARSMPVLEADRPDQLKLLRANARSVYTPTRIDTLRQSPTVGPALWRFRPTAMFGQWKALAISDPFGYARRRLEVFRWVFLTPQIDLCVPIILGVSGLPDVARQLGLIDGHWQQDPKLYAYTSRWFATPVYSHLTYACLAALVAGFLLIRRSSSDIAMAALMIGVLGFTATFLFISVACDYRYLYALDLAAITGVLYIAIDPSFRREKAGGAP
jgi:hypothetical protein